MAQQSIKSGTRSYAEVSAVRKRIPMRSQIEALIAGFGRERVDVRGFGRGFFTNGDLLSDFCQAINRPEVDALLDKGGPANESMTLETALNIDRHRARTGDSRVIRADDPRFREGNTRFRLPEKTLRSIRDVARPDCDWLATEFGIEFAM